ncbi:MAG: hypothetical protein ACFE7R_03040 [Candidatus Hodarchaeota archaeon]
MGSLDRYHVNLTGVDGQQLHPSRLKTLDYLLNNRFGPDFVLNSVERLRSKKNVVLYLTFEETEPGTPSELVAKLFVMESYDNELQKLRLSREGGLSVPDVFDASNGVILMSYIPGEPLVTRINRTFDISDVEELAKWYYKYHSIHKEIKADPRLRNFIWSKDGLFGVDFEESCKGHWITDIGGTAASILDTEPVNDPRKRSLSWHLLKNYLDISNIERTADIDKMFVQSIADHLETTARWRQSTEIADLAQQIRHSGLSL